MGKIPLASNQCTQFALLSDMKKKSVQYRAKRVSNWTTVSLSPSHSLSLTHTHSAVSCSLIVHVVVVECVGKFFIFNCTRRRELRQKPKILKRLPELPAQLKAHLVERQPLLLLLRLALPGLAWPGPPTNLAQHKARLHAERAILWKFLATSQPRLASRQCLHLNYASNSPLSALHSLHYTPGQVYSSRQAGRPAGRALLCANYN